MNKNKNKIIALQLSRIIACLMVFIVHLGQYLELKGIVRQFTDFGRFGVQLFFIMSGYLAAISLSKKVDTKTYYKKRAIKILPLYYFSILFLFIYHSILNSYFSYIPNDPYHLYWLRYIFLLNGFLPSKTFDFWNNLGITWTIPIFVFFYLIIPLLMKKIKGIKSSLIILIITYLISLNPFYKCTIIEYLYIFFIGIFIFFCNKEKKNNECTLFFTIIAIIRLILEQIPYVELLAIIIIVSTNIIIKASKKTQKIIDILDEHSYTLYLVHGIVIYEIIGYLDECHIIISHKMIFLIAIVFTPLFTYLIHKYIEKPIQNYLTKKLIQ